MLLHILLSAAACNLAFFSPDHIGFLVLFAPLPLLHFFYSFPSPWTGFKAGWWWGLCIFGFHFTWLLELLLRHTAASRVVCWSLYVLVVSYFALGSACWLWITALLSQRYRILPAFVCSSILYWYYIERWIFVLPGLGTGYPFLNPCIPLASYTLFLRMISVASLSVASPVAKPVNVAHILPVINRVKNITAGWRASPQGVAHKIHYQLSVHERSDVYVTPESMFPFALNQHPELIRFWATALPQAGHLFIGSIFQKGDARYQAVYWLQQNLIINLYVKKMLTPFVENIPTAWRNVPKLKQLFLKDGTEFCDESVSESVEYFDVTPTLRIIPRICLELFFLNRTDFEQYQDPSKNIKIFFFANDSWFNEFFRKLMYNFVTIKSHRIGLPIVYIGHFGCCEITRDL